MIKGLKLLIEYADAIPELRIFNVFKGVKSMLISIEALLKVFHEEIAMA